MVGPFWVNASWNARAQLQAKLREEEKERRDARREQLWKELVQTAGELSAGQPTSMAARLMASPGREISWDGGHFVGVHSLSRIEGGARYWAKMSFSRPAPILQGRTRFALPTDEGWQRVFTGIASIDRSLLISGAADDAAAEVFATAAFVASVERLGARALSFEVLGDGTSAILEANAKFEDADLARVLRFANALFDLLGRFEVRADRVRRIYPAADLAPKADLLERLLDSIRSAADWLSGSVDRIPDGATARLLLNEGAREHSCIVTATVTARGIEVSLAATISFHGEARLDPQAGFLSAFRRWGEIEIGDPAVDDAWIIRADSSSSALLVRLSSTLAILRTHSAHVSWRHGQLDVRIASVGGGLGGVAEAVGASIELWRKVVQLPHEEIVG